MPDRQISIDDCAAIIGRLVIENKILTDENAALRARLAEALKGREQQASE